MSTRGTQTNPARLPDAPSSGVHNTVAPTLNNGDQTALQLDANGNLNVNVQVGGGGGGGTVNQGNQGTAAEGWFVELTDGTNVLGTSTYPVRVDPTGTTTQPVSISATLSDNIAQWGGTAVSAPPASGVPAVGTEVAPVVKPIQRKNTSLSTSTPLSANGVYTSGWIDTQQTGDHFISVEYVSNVIGASIVIQETDNTSDAAFRTTATHTSPAATTRWVRRTPISARYYQVVYTNGATLQTSFELTVTGSSTSSIPVVVSSANGLAQIQGGSLVAVGSDLAAPIISVITTSGGVANSGADNILDVNNSTGALGKLGTVQFAVTDGTTGGQQAAIRTPNVFKTAQATASGNTALWTPTSGKKFRLMRLFVQVTANAYLDSGAGVLTVTFQDATTGINLAFDVYLPAASVSAPLGDAFASDWIDLGNGVLSATANNVLNINLSGKVDAGNVRVTCCGTEE